MLLVVALLPIVSKESVPLLARLLRCLVVRHAAFPAASRRRAGRPRRLRQVTLTPSSSGGRPAQSRSRQVTETSTGAESLLSQDSLPRSDSGGGGHVRRRQMSASTTNTHDSGDTLTAGDGSGSADGDADEHAAHHPGVAVHTQPSREQRPSAQVPHIVESEYRSEDEGTTASGSSAGDFRGRQGRMHPSLRERSGYGPFQLPTGGAGTPMGANCVQDAAVELAAGMHARFGAAAFEAVQKLGDADTFALYSAVQRSIWVCSGIEKQLPPYLKT